MKPPVIVEIVIVRDLGAGFLLLLARRSAAAAPCQPRTTTSVPRSSPVQPPQYRVQRVSTAHPIVAYATSVPGSPYRGRQRARLTCGPRDLFFVHVGHLLRAPDLVQKKEKRTKRKKIQKKCPLESACMFRAAPHGHLGQECTCFAASRVATGTPAPHYLSTGQSDIAVPDRTQTQYWTRRISAPESAYLSTGHGVSQPRRARISVPLSVPQYRGSHTGLPTCDLAVLVVFELDRNVSLEAQFLHLAGTTHSAISATGLWVHSERESAWLTRHSSRPALSRSPGPPSAMQTGGTSR
eukprot:936978-Rhodomonas_salina.1